MTLEEAKRLSPETINAKIAEALGWKRAYPEQGDNPWWFNGNEMVHVSKIPDFFHDMNALKTGISALTKDELIQVRSLIREQWPHFVAMFYPPEDVTAISLAVVLSERKK